MTFNTSRCWKQENATFIISRYVIWNITSLAFFENIFEIRCFTFAHSQASDGWLYYFKKKYSIVDRHIDKVCVTRPIDDDNELDHLVDKFKTEQIPIIMAYAPNKVLFQ